MGMVLRIDNELRGVPRVAVADASMGETNGGSAGTLMFPRSPGYRTQRRAHPFRVQRCDDSTWTGVEQRNSHAGMGESYFGVILMATVGQTVSHAIQKMQSASRRGSDLSVRYCSYSGVPGDTVTSFPLPDAVGSRSQANTFTSHSSIPP